MFGLLLSWALAAGALMLASRVFRGVTLRGDFADALWVAATFSILSFLLSWLLFGVLGVATLGLGFVFHFLTQLVTAAIVLRLTSWFSSRFELEGFVPALGTAFFLAVAGEIGARVFEI